MAENAAKIISEAEKNATAIHDELAGASNLQRAAAEIAKQLILIRAELAAIKMTIATRSK